MHFPPVGKMRAPALLSHRSGRREGKYISSSQMKILTFSIVKVKCEKGNTNIKNLLSPGFGFVGFF